MIISIITAAGSGSRMNSGTKKQYLEINGESILNRTIHVFCSVDEIDHIVLVLPRGETDYPVDKFNKKINAVIGGEQRAHSVINGLEESGKIFNENNIIDNERFVLIHDGVRPLTSNSLIKSVIDTTLEQGSAIPVCDLNDTIVQRDSDGKAIKYPPRGSFSRIQTPQGYLHSSILNSYKELGPEAALATDESSVLFLAGFQPVFIPGEEHNIKITRPDDLKLAEYLLSRT